MNNKLTTPSSRSIAWIPIAGLGFAMISIGLMAIMSVLSLIPSFITTNDFPSITQRLFQLNIIYTTDFINGSSLTVDNTNVLSNSLNNALNLYGIDNITAQFIPSIIYMHNEKDKTIVSRQNNYEESMGDLLSFNLSVIYPKECYTSKCQQRYVNKVLMDISTIFFNFSLPIQFTNGVISNVKLTFCSFNSYEKCQITLGAKTCNDTDIDENEKCHLNL